MRHPARLPALAVIAAAAILGAVGRAHADPPPARTSSLAWVRMPGAEACIDARALAQAVELRLGRAAFVAPTRGEVAIEARIERLQSPDAWHATITVFDEAGARTGLRELQTDRSDCRAIDDELELVIALLIDPGALLATPMLPAPPPFTPPAPRPAEPPAPLVCPPPAPAPVEPWRTGVAAGPIAEIGLLPSTVGVGLAIRAHLAPPRGPSFELGGSLWAHSMVQTGAGDRTFSLAYGWLSVCPIDLARGGTALTACLGAQIGSLRVSDVDIPSKYRQEQLVLDVAAEARARRRFIGPLFGSLGLGIAAPTVRDRFYFTDAQGARHDVFQVSPVAALLDLALGLELP
jgi:hypothetical protein